MRGARQQQQDGNGPQSAPADELAAALKLAQPEPAHARESEAPLLDLSAATLVKPNQDLPEEVQLMVQAALDHGGDYANFIEATDYLAARGGMASAQGLAKLLEVIVLNDGLPGYVSMGGPHVAMYSVVTSMLDVAERRGGYSEIKPREKLSREEKRAVNAFVNELAVGKHENGELTYAARGAIFERFGNLPVVGGLLSFAVKVASWRPGDNDWITGNAERRGLKALHFLMDLRWKFSGGLKSASTDALKGNLREVLATIAKHTPAPDPE